MSEGGQRAAASHTGSLAGAVHIWQAFFRQTGAVPVDTLDETIEQIVAFQHFRPPKGRAVGIVARGGGPGVIVTDQCERVGLSVPPLPAAIRGQLEKWTPAEAGSNVSNPVEIGLGRAGLSEHYAKSLELVASSPNIDMILTMLIPHIYTHFGMGEKEIEDATDILIDIARRLPKPMAVVIPPGDSIDTIVPVLKAHEKGISQGLAIFSDMGIAVKAISKVFQYYQFTQNRSE
jgi:acetyltransferase